MSRRLLAWFWKPRVVSPLSYWALNVIWFVVMLQATIYFVVWVFR